MSAEDYNVVFLYFFNFPGVVPVKNSCFSLTKGFALGFQRSPEVFGALNSPFRFSGRSRPSAKRR